MKKIISILGSTGSIGKSTVEIILKNKKKFEVFLLVANNDYLNLYKQAIKTNARFVYLANIEKSKLLKKKLSKNRNIKVINNFKELEKVFTKKNDLLVSGISGLNGLEYNLKLISKTKKILIANKESIICGWNLIKKELIKNNTKLEPIDSEHFAIAQLVKMIDQKFIKYVYITASGGPFLKKNITQLKSVSVKSALNHPNWKMGKKISIDSATLVNKVFEIIECYRLFNINKDKFKIIIHPQSFIHSIVFLKNGTSIALMHKPDMKIPISFLLGIDNFNSDNYFNYEKNFFPKKLEFEFVDKKRFPIVSILKNISKKTSLFESLLVSSNDMLVDKFLNKKISFNDITKKLLKLIKKKEFYRLQNIKPKNIKQIRKIQEHSMLKTSKLSIL